LAIRGLTDRPASFPQIGILRKGSPSEKKVNQAGKEYNSVGRDLKHFRFDTDDTEAARAFRTVYGDEPTSIRIYLPFATAGENWEAWQEHWTAGALQHRCDGQTCVLHLNGQRYSQQAVPCPHQKLDAHERDRCKPVGRLKVVIPELRRLAYVTVLTGSIHDIIAISEQLAALESLRGDLRGVPMTLRRTPRDISMPGQNGKRTRVEKWLISVEAAPTWVDLQLAAQERAALPMQPALLPAPAADVATGEIAEASYTAEDDADPDADGDVPTPDTVRALWSRVREAGQDIPPKIVSLDLDTLTTEQLAKLEVQARGWLEKLNQGNVPAPNPIAEALL
jgi:hypothetical protein